MTTETNQPTAESSPTPGASRHYELPPLGENLSLIHISEPTRPY